MKLLQAAEAFVLKEIGTNGISLFTSWNDIEVIGNIYDNKDLLK